MRHHLALLALIALGCGASHGPTDASDADAGIAIDGGASAEVDAFLSAYARAVCEGLDLCSDNARYLDVETCLVLEPAVSQSFDFGHEWQLVPWGIAASVESGRVQFDPVAAEACLLQAAGNCPSTEFREGWQHYEDHTGPCSRVFRAEPSSLSSECNYDEECARNAFCGEGPLCGSRTCQTRRAPGEPCTSASQCATSDAGYSMCASQTLTCANISRIESMASEGEQCGAFMSDTILRVCAPGTACLFDGVDFRCLGVGAPGEPCGADLLVPCQFAESCDLDSMLCTTGDVVLTPKHEGEECPVTPGLTWLYCHTNGELLCDSATSTCVRNRGAIGDACFYFECMEGLDCDATYRCTLPTALPGEPCTRPQMCVSGCCTDGVCGEP